MWQAHPSPAFHHLVFPGTPEQHRTPDWLEGELFERRVVLVAGQLDQILAMRVAAELMTLDASGTDPVDIYVDSPDGTLEAAFVLIDTLDLLQAPTRTHALGEVGGVALGVLAVGNHRTAAPHARFRLGEPAVQLQGRTDQLLTRSQQRQLLLERFRARLARATGRTVAEIADDMRQSRCLDAQEALGYGLIDAIADAALHGNS